MMRKPRQTRGRWSDGLAIHKRAYASMMLVTLCAVTSSTVGGDIRIESAGIKTVQEVEVPALEAGVLRDVCVHEGQVVEAGKTVLARVDERDVQLELGRAEIQLRSAQHAARNDVKLRMSQERLKLAELDLERGRTSLERFPKSVTQSQMQRLQIAVAQAQLEIELARHDMTTLDMELQSATSQLALARRRVQRHTVVAPIDGTVVQIHHRQGEWVKPGDAVVRIVRSDVFRAEGFVDIQQVSDDLLGRDVTLIVALPKNQVRRFPGKVNFVSPEVNPVNFQVRVWADIDNVDGQLRSGLSATMLIHVSTKKKE